MEHTCRLEIYLTYGNILKGNREGKQIFGSVNLGKRLNDEKFNLNPGIKIDLGYTELAAFRENTTLGDSQSDALIYKKQKGDELIEQSLVQLAK